MAALQRPMQPAPGGPCANLPDHIPWRQVQLVLRLRTVSGQDQDLWGGGRAKKGWGTSLDIQNYPETRTHTHDFWGPLHSLAVRLAVEYWELRGRAGLLGCTLNEAESQVIGQDLGARSGRPGSAGWAPVPGHHSGSLSRFRANSSSKLSSTTAKFYFGNLPT